MVARSRGSRSKTRNKLKKRIREKSNVPITRAMQTFTEGDSVHIVIDSAYQKGAPHPKWHGKTGKVKESRGRAYLVNIRDQKSEKTLIASPIHLKKAS
jgi:large subunit ribosomal protein L21e